MSPYNKGNNSNNQKVQNTYLNFWEELEFCETIVSIDLFNKQSCELLQDKHKSRARLGTCHTIYFDSLQYHWYI